MTYSDMASTKRNRIHWMDNLRTIIIFLVVLYHVGGVYEAAGLWASFWIVDDPSTITWVDIVGIVFDIFIMPTISSAASRIRQMTCLIRSSRLFTCGSAEIVYSPLLQD